MNTEMSLIGNNNLAIKAFLSLYNRNHKLISAVFLVLNIIEKDNELKTRIKELALDTVSLCVALKNTEHQQMIKDLNNIEKKILELISLLDIASMSGLISEMNSSVLQTEFKLFLDLLSDYAKNVEIENGDIIKNMLMVEKLTADKMQRSLPEKPTPNLSIKDNYKGHTRKDTRRVLILEFIRTHSKSSIKDIAPNVKGCSEKTIQRELISLVKMGQVNKIGERRWSRYSIK